LLLLISPGPDPAPRYHARDAAIVLAAYHKVLLGSATPSIETFLMLAQESLAWYQ
jgi:primosomal protein N' (replication factor Y)